MQEMRHVLRYPQEKKNYKPFSTDPVKKKSCIASTVVKKLHG